MVSSTEKISKGCDAHSAADAKRTWCHYRAIWATQLWNSEKCKQSNDFKNSNSKLKQKLEYWINTFFVWWFFSWAKKFFLFWWLWSISGNELNLNALKGFRALEKSKARQSFNEYNSVDSFFHSNHHAPINE